MQMMHRLKEFIKNNKVIYFLYYITVSLFVNIIKVFLKADDKLILFVSYGGRHYSDSPRIIYEAMLHDNRFKDYKLVWAFVEPTKFNVEHKIRIDSIKYYITSLKARCWVTNVMIERALNYTGIHTYYFFTTHGILVKCDGPDLKQYKFSSLSKIKYDCCLSQSEYEKKIEMRMFGLHEDKVKILGYPKDDIFANYTEEYRLKLRKKLRIPDDKKAILYAPTFREDMDLREAFEMDIEKWRRELSDNYILLYRAHPVVSAKHKENDDFFRDETDYEMVEDLMIASDILVSDYSGIIFDYCLMHKPIFLWTYDYDEYEKRRGLYFDIRKELPYGTLEEEVIQLIKDNNYNIKNVVDFQQKYETVFGKGTENSLNDIWNNIQ